MKIGTRYIGPGKPVFVVAEVGSNFRHLGDCMDSIRAAAHYGADAVKFQMFRQEELYGRFEGLSRDHELSRFWIPSLAQMALECDIEFMCSAFSEAGVEILTPYVAAHKIASCEATHPGIVNACQRSGIPTFVSSGAMHFDEYSKLISLTWPSGVIPTYCRASYPANDAQPWRFDSIIGWNKCLSDHTTDVFPIAMRSHNFCAIEKHVNFVGATGPDADHSMSPEDFGRMVKFLRNLGKGEIQDECPPNDIMEFHRRRFIPELGGWYRVKA